MAEVIWAPWRVEYILSSKSKECIFCLPQTADDDRERLILLRRERTFVMMNRYPYNSGHLMVVPFQHVADIEAVDEQTGLEILRLVQQCKAVLSAAMHPQGFNIGMNLGSAAGAGIDQHLHIHIVPRWNGDTNFMPVIGDVRMISEHLRATYDKLRPLFK
ncbi:MAG TPA: HIT domain-containing protein [Thermodesulfobacteriota bacterium]|nr:HIT domain-containing protein [Deltaproteobacteria bacterium]HNU73151.1 HIT domain-containing protein [Thermodesulfobacteriota bacterium]HOC39492.1 HIT domain-containing protein [Thermodesulfobacteriota bacterium]